MWHIQSLLSVMHTLHFLSFIIYFHLNTDFASQFCVFTVKSPIVTQRWVSQEIASKKSLRLFSQNYILLLLLKTITGFKESVKFEFKVTVHCGLWANCSQLWSLKHCKTASLFGSCSLIYALHYNNVENKHSIELLFMGLVIGCLYYDDCAQMLHTSKQSHPVKFDRAILLSIIGLIFQLRDFKGIFSDSNSTFLWHKSGDNIKGYFQNFS